jgi:hypothetical protein
MRSNARSDRLDLDLEQDLPTTAEDNDALRRVTAIRPLDLEEYLHFLDQLPCRTPDELRGRRGPRSDGPFVIG